MRKDALCGRRSSMTKGPGIARTLLPTGFTAAGVNCGVRRYRPDLGIILSDRPSTAAGVFTQNALAAAPVRHCQAILPADSIRAIITNSGQANAATGPEGERANREMAFEVAKELGCYPVTTRELYRRHGIRLPVASAGLRPRVGPRPGSHGLSHWQGLSASGLAAILAPAEQ